MDLQIAIDGPAAAGKSTVAKMIADKMNYIYIDTGAMYRAITLKALENKVDVEDSEALYQLLKKTVIELVAKEKGQAVILDQKDVTESIRLPEVTNNVSFVSKHPKLREEMVKRQQELAAKQGVVMDGRDIGTKVLPNAEVKVFLKASVEERATRRYKEQINKGIETPLEELKKEIALRDTRDSIQLVKAHDAVEIDTTKLSIADVVDRILAIIKERTYQSESL
ncbi:cytidylate kinase [Pullulanibacillus pueri]|uniref:Cytidylate kinase n=1 Tax=Pullulanibacillus pueri TaxID=1437324 RepID=A0A8J3ELE6_9BACL|nr:(d)CMP kinase [Pullulanibacillus pueri]MBM7681481.1 cytidylate kinase [Pullulanibacillus pueri]GGH79052.1 cytidylate kinase [Pullulanibacillus pueri]